MTDDGLNRLFERFGHGGDRSDRGGEAARPTALVVSCTMARDSRVVPPWPAAPSWPVVAVPTLGNVAWERQRGDRSLAGAVAGPATEHDLGAVVVVGHTECDVVADAYERYRRPDPETPAGIKARLAPLVAVVGDAVDAGVVDPSTAPRTAQCRLVEYHVVRQVDFLASALPPAVTVAGYVHDEDGAYSSFPDERYLVTVDGETDADGVRARLPGDRTAKVASLLP